MAVAATPVKDENEPETIVWKWVFGTTATDTGAAIKLPQHADVTWQVEGTPGGATVSIDGSNEGTTFSPLNHAAGGTACTFAAAGIKTTLENPVYKRPSISGATGTTALTVTGHFRKGYRSFR
jgi:hypothetical protein